MKPAYSKLPFPMPRHEQPLESEKKEMHKKTRKKAEKNLTNLDTYFSNACTLSNNLIRLPLFAPLLPSNPNL